MKIKMKTRLLFVASLLFTLCLSIICGLGFTKSTRKVSAESTTLEMVSGASVRLIADDPGLRFMASISKEEYAAVKNANGTFYMFILPNSYRESAEIDETHAFGTNAVYCWDAAQEGKTQIVRCTANELTQTSEDGNTYYFACALTSIKTQNYEVDFFARAYYEVNGVRTWAPLNENNVRSVSYVAQKALGDAEYTPTESGKTALLEYVTQFEEVGATAGETCLYVADLANVASIAVDGEAATYTNTDGKAVLSNLTKGRHTATVTHNDGSTWDVPFVYADYVIRDYDDLSSWVNTNTNGTSTTDVTYTVIAQDINITNTTALARSSPSTYQTLDGYGHTITGFRTKTWGLMNSITHVTVRDLAFVNAVTSGYTVLAGAFTNTSGTTSRIENVFLSGRRSGTIGTSTITLLVSTLTAKNQVVGCVVIDNTVVSGESACLGAKGQGALGRIADTATFEAVNYSIAVTDGYALASSSSNQDNLDIWLEAGETSTNAKVGKSDTDVLKAKLKALAMNANDETIGWKNCWTYDEGTDTLYLNGNAIYTVA